jgi:hypothetical protein
MSFLRSAILAGALAAAPGLALADGGHAQSTAPPCGWRGGALADPAATQACLAYRYKAPKQKPAEATPAPATPPPATPAPARQ